MIDYTSIMNPSWARWFDTIAQQQGQDPSQPYNLNFAGQLGNQAIGANQRPSLKGLQALQTPTSKTPSYDVEPSYYSTQTTQTPARKRNV